MTFGTIFGRTNKKVTRGESWKRIGKCTDSTVLILTKQEFLVPWEALQKYKYQMCVSFMKKAVLV